VVVGDSFTWGWGVNDDEIYTERLAALLPDVDVINLGVTAYDLRQEMQYFLREGLRQAPDVLLVSLCLNDIYRVPRSDAVTPMAASDDDSLWSRTKRAVGVHSVLYRFVLDRINTNKRLVRALVTLRIKGELSGFDELDVNLMPALRIYPPRLQESWLATQEELLAFKRVTAELGIRLILGLVPSVQSVVRETFDASLAYSTFDVDDFDLEKPYRLLQEFARTHDIEVVSPLPEFRRAHARGQRLYFRNDMHFNQDGHALFARAIAEHMSGKRPRE
jgi:lysophospholipase L1-like esterase